MSNFLTFEEKVNNFIDKLFEENQFIKFNKMNVNNNTKDKDFCWDVIKNKYEKYDNGKLVKRNEVVYQNGEKIKDEKYEAPKASIENNENNDKICGCGKSYEDGCCGETNCKCHKTPQDVVLDEKNIDNDSNQTEESVDNDVIKGYEEIVRRGTKELYTENVSLKSQIEELSEELKNTKAYNLIYQETLKEQNDAIQDLMSKLEKYKEIEKIINNK